MKFMQLLYPGLGGTSTVAFSIIDSQKKNSSKINNYFIFYGIEKLTKNNKEICFKKKIDFLFFLKKNYINDNLKIYKKIKLIKPDLIISHSNSLLALILYKILCKKKFYCVDHTPDNTKTFKNWINLFMFSFFSNGVILVSKLKKDSLSYKFFNFFNIKYKVILNGIDTVKFQRYRKILINRKTTIGMAARFVDDKKQSLIINTFIKNKIYFEKHGFIFKFAGDGNNLNFLKKVVKLNKLNHLIKFQGNLNEKKLIQWFQGIDIYFHLSKGEQTSTAILQALSMSNPIFASKIYGNIQLKNFIGSKNFFLIENDDKSIIKSFNYINKNKILLKKLSLNIKKDYNHRISSKNLFKKYITFTKN